MYMELLLYTHESLKENSLRFKVWTFFEEILSKNYYLIIFTHTESLNFPQKIFPIFILHYYWHLLFLPHSHIFSFSLSIHVDVGELSNKALMLANDTHPLWHPLNTMKIYVLIKC